MQRKNLRKIAGFILMVLMIPGVAFLSASTTQAQRRGGVVIVRTGPRLHGFHRGFDFAWYPYPYPYPYYGYYNNYVFGSSESASDQGYRDGLRTGENDVRRHQSYNPERSHYFREAGFGNYGGDYRDAFLRGYESGYRS